MSGRVTVYADDPIAHGQLLNRHSELFRAELQQFSPRRRGCHAQRLTARRYCIARSCLAAVRGQIGVAAHDADSIECDIKLISHHLSKTGPVARSHINATREDGDTPIVCNGQV